MMTTEWLVLFLDKLRKGVRTNEAYREQEKNNRTSLRTRFLGSVVETSDIATHPLPCPTRSASHPHRKPTYNKPNMQSASTLQIT